MGSVSQSITTTARPDQVWDAVRDFGNPHKRLVPGFVTDARIEGDARIVTFAGGMVAREPLITIDEQAKRLVWSADSTGFTHYNGALQVFPDGQGSRVVWTSDFLPDATQEWVAGMLGAGLTAMKANLDDLQ
jgi:carbon monoxide dehydrogenase subunit G